MAVFKFTITFLIDIDFRPNSVNPLMLFSDYSECYKLLIALLWRCPALSRSSSSSFWEPVQAAIRRIRAARDWAAWPTPPAGAPLRSHPRQRADRAQSGLRKGERRAGQVLRVVPPAKPLAARSPSCSVSLSLEWFSAPAWVSCAQPFNSGTKNRSGLLFNCELYHSYSLRSVRLYEYYLLL